MEGARDGQRRTALLRLAGEVVARFYRARHAAVQVGPPGVVGAVHGEGEAAVVGEFEVQLAVFAGVGGIRAGADACGEGGAEVWGDG